MEFSYKNIKKQIKLYYQNKSHIEEIITDPIIINTILNSLKQNNENDLITDFCLVNTNSIKVLFYDSTNKLNNKKTSHILTYQTVDKNYPIFKLDYNESNGKKVDYHEAIYSIYKNNSYKLSSKISFKTLSDNEFENTDVIILESIDNTRYHRKEYNLSLKLNELLSIRANNTMYITGEEGFINRELLVMKDICDSIKKIESKIKETIGEDIKIYQIKRKIKKV